MILAAFLAGFTIGAGCMFGGLLLYARAVGERIEPDQDAPEYGEWPHLPRDGSRGYLEKGE